MPANGRAWPGWRPPSRGAWHTGRVMRPRALALLCTAALAGGSMIAVGCGGGTLEFRQTPIGTEDSTESVTYEVNIK